MATIGISAVPQPTKTGWVRRALRAIAISRAEECLMGLDDRTLAQAGITRAEIPELARRIHS